ncbi:MAG TPA: response regulator transcription factor [Thermoanaerobaculia bacterium]|nr:response regulator transcription factor [Thermoanaerobaculia bacterium]
MIRVVVADDQAIVREGVAALLRLQADMDVVGEAGSVGETIDLTLRHRPDVVVIDISMPVGGGLRAVTQLREAGVQSRFLTLTMHQEPAIVRSAITAGVTGYVLKSDGITELGAAIRAVHQGRSYINVPLAPGGLESMLGSSARPVNGRGAALSRREEEVLKLLAAGHTYRAIAASLHVSEKSVETYRARLWEKLHLQSRVDLIRYAMLHGLLDEAS